MSLMVTTDIQCDDPSGCLMWEHGTTGAGVRPTEARDAAARCGWTSKRTPHGWIDLCPYHSPRPIPGAESGEPDD